MGVCGVLALGSYLPSTPTPWLIALPKLSSLEVKTRKPHAQEFVKNNQYLGGKSSGKPNTATNWGCNIWNKQKNSQKFHREIQETKRHNEL